MKLQQTSRLRQAWKALRTTVKASEDLKRWSREESDFYELLSSKDFEDIHDAYYMRYKSTYSPEVDPADTLVSRIRKELTKRVLTHRNVWAVRTKAHQYLEEHGLHLGRHYMVV